MDLIENEFSAQTFKKLAYKGETFKKKEFDSCTFQKCVFSEAIFEDCLFRNCVFKDCELNLIKVPGCSFSATRFENSHLVGMNWSETSMAANRLTIAKPVSFSGCALNHSIFMWLSLKEIQLSKCTARDADFSEADLTDADCRGTDFSNSRFWHTNLTGADFTGAMNYTIPANLNTLKKTKFSLPEAMSLLYSLDIILNEEE
jgi:fluoroquinolone resistance protein